MNRFLLFICLLFGILSANAANFTISGTVVESGSLEQLPGVTIFDAGKQIGTTSNRYGFYSLTLPEGEYTISYLFIGYEKQVISINLTKDTSIDISLGPLKEEMGTVTIIGNRQANESQHARMSTIDIPIQQIKDIPTFLGEKDVLKTLQLMPGVQSGSEGQSGIYVRGGGPDQNLIILDDAVVYNASHLFGFFSLFNGDALKSVELIKGGFPARYGGRLSSVVDMTMKEGNRDHFAGEFGIGAISSRLVLEGPLPGTKKRGSFVVAARRTYIDVLVQPIILAATKGDQTFGYFFHDLNLKLNYDLGPKDRIYLSGYFGKDKFYSTFKIDSFKEKANLGWGNSTGTLRWNHQINNKMFSNTSLVMSNFRLGINAQYDYPDEQFNLDFGSSIRDYTLKYDVDYYPNPKHFVKVGAVVTYHRFSPNAIVIKGTNLPQIDHKNITNAYESGLYLEDTWQPINRLKINLGFRLSHFVQGKKQYLNPEPRISTAFSINPLSSVKFSYALMNQYIHLLSNTGIGLPTDLWVPATQRVKPQRSQQWAAGFVRDMPALNLSVTIEGYYKIMNNILGYKEGSSFLQPEFDGNEFSFGDWQDKVTSGKGTSYGAELFVQRKYGNFSGWIGYTLSWTWLQFDELNNGKKYFAKYDRRHDLSLVGIYKINERIKISGVWVYGTGNAISLAGSTSPGRAYFPNDNSNVLWYNDIYNFGQKNSYRMNAYHRMDVGAQFIKETKRGNLRTWEISVYNAYNRANPFFLTSFVDDPDNNHNTNNDVRKLYQVSLFPVLPSLSYSLKF